MAEKYAIVNTDLMSATDDRSRMRSFKYGAMEGDEFTGKDIQNGSVVTLLNDKRLDRDLWIAVDPTASTALDDIVLVTTPEIMYDERLKSLHDFYNEADTNATGMVLKVNDIFSVTEEALDGTPEVGQPVSVQAGTKIKVGAGGTQIGTIIEKWVHNKDVYWAIRVG